LQNTTTHVRRLFSDLTLSFFVLQDSLKPRAHHASAGTALLVKSLIVHAMVSDVHPIARPCASVLRISLVTLVVRRRTNSSHIGRCAWRRNGKFVGFRNQVL
jgi:hypothetical protein